MNSVWQRVTYPKIQNISCSLLAGVSERVKKGFVWRVIDKSVYTSYFNTILIYPHLKHIQNAHKLYCLGFPTLTVVMMAMALALVDMTACVHDKALARL